MRLVWKIYHDNFNVLALMVYENDNQKHHQIVKFTVYHLI
jgi:hypothetical protein